MNHIWKCQVASLNQLLVSNQPGKLAIEGKITFGCIRSNRGD